MTDPEVVSTLQTLSSQDHWTPVGENELSFTVSKYSYLYIKCQYCY